jgi:putative ABC transport system ATP-binding protein
LSGLEPALLRLRDLQKAYRSQRVEVCALRGVSFDVGEGEFAAIMGPSGSGKTTLLDILGCLARPTAGSYHLAGRPAHALEDEELATLRNRHIGFVFQQFNLLARASVLENVELPLLYARVPAAERRTRARAVLDRVGLSHRLEHRPNELSGGQMQRVAIARALVTEPVLILADEPTGNLDSAAAASVMDLLTEVHAQGRTVILVTHDPGVASHADRMIRLRDGVVVADQLTRRRRHAAHAH